MASVLLALAGIGVLLLLIVWLLVWGVRSYNRLVRLRNQVSGSWAQIDVQLKRRHSLIPNLVETVKGYATHERDTLDSVVSARASAIGSGATDAADRAAAESVLSRALGRLFAVAEAYPDLKANQNFLALQSELSTTENKIAYARQFFNGAVQSNNSAVQSFPTSLIASMFGFGAHGYFEAGEGERADVGVRF
jgi:LemA protein